MSQPGTLFQVFSTKTAQTAERLPAMHNRRSVGGRRVRMIVLGQVLKGDRNGINISKTQILEDIDRLRSLDELGLIFFRDRHTLQVVTLADIAGPAPKVDAPEPEPEVVDEPEAVDEEPEPAAEPAPAEPPPAADLPEPEAVEEPEPEEPEAVEPVAEEPEELSLEDSKGLIKAELGRAKLREIAEFVGAQPAASNQTTADRILVAIDESADSLTGADIEALVNG